MQTENRIHLDEYFCSQYANQTKLAAIPGFVQPVVNAETILSGDVERYKLSHQKEKETLLAAFKQSLVDKDFSFSFTEKSLFKRMKERKNKNTFEKVFSRVAEKYSLDKVALYRELTVSESIWRKILKGVYNPSKNLILALSLSCGLSGKDASLLLSTCDYRFDAESVRDVVVTYLLSYGIYNNALVWEALDEYKITCLPLKRA